MRIVFCDDEPDMLEQVKDLVTEFFADKQHLEIQYAWYDNGETLLQNENIVDIAFLDVEMSGQTGLEVATQLKRINPYAKIFIITAHPDYFDDVMELELFHFFEKPVNRQRLYRRLTSAVNLYVNNTVLVTIETPDGLVTALRSSEIVYIKAEARYSMVYTTTNCYKVRCPFKHLARQLVLPSFVSPGRGELVNLTYATGFDKDFIYLAAVDHQHKVYMTRRKYIEVKRAYLQYVEATR